jgi:uncharacterized protein
VAQDLTAEVGGLELKGAHELPAARSLAWAMLNDVAVLRACVPGSEAFTEKGDGRYEVAITAAIGPVRARFKGEIEIADLDEPNGYTLKFEGSGGAAGFTRGQARVTLTPVGPNETQLTYVGHAQIGGKLAQVGSRVVDAAAAAMTDRFFEAFTGQLTARSQSTPGYAAPRLGLWPLLKSFFKRLFRAPEHKRRSGPRPR